MKQFILTISLLMMGFYSFSQVVPTDIIFSKKEYVSGVNDTIPVVLTTFQDSSLSISIGEQRDTAYFEKREDAVFFKSRKTACHYGLTYRSKSKRMDVTVTDTHNANRRLTLCDYGYFTKCFSYDKLDKEQLDNVKNLAMLSYKNGKKANCISLLRKSIPRSPGYSNDYLLWGTACVEVGLTKEAKKAYEQYVVYSRKSSVSPVIPERVKKVLGSKKIRSLVKKEKSDKQLKKKQEKDLKRVQNKKAGLLKKIYYVNEKGKKIKQVKRKQTVYLVVKSKNMKGCFINLDMHDEDIMYEYKGIELTERIVEDIVVTSNKMRIELRALRRIK